MSKSTYLVVVAREAGSGREGRQTQSAADADTRFPDATKKGTLYRLQINTICQSTYGVMKCSLYVFASQLSISTRSNNT